MLQTTRSYNQSGLRLGPPQQSSNANNNNKQQQQTSPKQHRHGYSQQQSTSSGSSYSTRRKDYVVMPTQFLLGGNVHDPLNLAALTDQADLNQVTPINSPLPTPPQHNNGGNKNNNREIEVLIPADMNDPLRLNQTESGDNSNDNLLLCRPLTSPQKFNNRNNKHRNNMMNNNNNNNNNNMGNLNKRRRCDSDGAMMESCKLDLTPHKRIRCSPILNTRLASSGEPCVRTPYTRLAAARAIHSANLMQNNDRHFLKRDLFPMSLDASTRPHQHQQVPPLSCIQLPPPTFSQPSMLPGPMMGPSSLVCPVNNNNNNRSQLGNSNVCLKRFQDAHPAQMNKYTQSERRFQYGNYNRYYGYRNSINQLDPRLNQLKREWFENMEVLDIGCNVGHLTLTVARDFNPKRIVGVDIDAQLIKSARNNIRNYVSKTNKKRDADNQAAEENESENSSNANATNNNGSSTPERCVLTDSPRINVIEESANTSDVVKSDQDNQDAKPTCQSSSSSLSTATASLNTTDLNESSPAALTSASTAFPKNVKFFAGNYVLMNDQLLEQQAPEYDTIMCMSVTKWVHLNWGDDGLRRLFRRVYRQLRPGGRFILEPQPWTSYCRKKGLTETTFRNFQQIKLRPEQFTEYLLSDQVGFASCEQLQTPTHQSKGFQRNIYVYTKKSN